MPGSGGGLPKVAAPSSSADSQQQSSPAVLVSNALKEAAAQLSRAINPEVKARPTIVVSMVDAENLQKTSALGRVLSQQMMYHLQANGWPIVDLRVSRELTMKPEGEFVLSRDLSKARGSLQVGNVVSGTYTDAGGVVVIAFQVSDLGTGTVLTNAQSVLEINPYVASLFKADVEVLSDAPVIRKVR
jgi:TolB-like protein